MSDACTNEPLGEDLYIRQLDGCDKKAGTDHKGLDLNGRYDLMVLVDSLRISTKPCF